MSGFETVPEQHEAKRLLAGALQEGPAHAYLFHGPAGVGKRELARRFAAELLGDHARVERGSHPDLYLLEPLGEQIRIDDIRELRRDLHMRPFEADRRVYLIFGADSLNEDAADALLKDLEEPPPYAVVVLVAERLGPLPETIRSRCQLVPFRRLSEPAVRQAIQEHAPDLGEEEVTTLAEAEQRVRRAQRGAEREELLALLEELESWYRDLVVVAAGAEAAAVHVDRLAELREDATLERMHTAEEACELVRAAWREAEELQVSTPLALEALLIRLRSELGATAAVA